MTTNTYESASKAVHQFHFSNDGVATCSCGRWAVTKVAMSAVTKEQTTRYGKEALDMEANGLRDTRAPFTPLTEDEAIKDWQCHIQNLPEKGGERVHSCAVIKRQRQQLMPSALITA